MREIKFRVWCKKNKKFLKDFEYPNGHSGLFLRVLAGEMTDIQLTGNEDGCSDISYDFFNPEFYDLVLRQFTGLKDKNGIDIYEGDVVSRFGDTQRSEVVFEAGCFMSVIQTGGGTPPDYDILCNDLDVTTVIGNIYENPDLLQ